MAAMVGSPSSGAGFTDLPENALEVLVKFLPLTDQGRAACVNKGLRDVIRPLSPDLRYHARAGNVGPLISVLRSREHCVSAKNNALLGLEASTKFDFEVASILLSSGASVDARDENEYNRTPLMLAVRKGCYEVVYRLLAFGADVNAVDELGYTPLLVAAASSVTGNCIARLVRAGADVNAVGPFGRTPLCLLMMGRQHYFNEALAAFLECGADVDAAATEDGDTPLMLAVTRRLCCRDVLLPLSRKANLEATNNRGETALFMAIRSRHAEAVGVLLAAGAVVRPEDSLLLKSFPEALSSACYFNKLGVVATLLALGGLANTVIGCDKTYGETVLMWASTRGFVDIVAQLCGQDPDLEAVNRQGKKALHLAACGKREEHLETVSVLLAAGAVPSGVSFAVISGNRQMVELLLAAGADVNAKECIGGHWSTPLCSAARRSAAMTSFILSCGALPNVLDANGMSPLLHAVDHTYEAVGETIEMLIAAGADMEARPVCADRCLASLYGGRTPLMRAVDIGSMVAFRALVAAGANVIAVDAKGWAVTKQIHASSHSVNVRNEMIRGVYRARGWPIPSEQDMHTAQ